MSYIRELGGGFTLGIAPIFTAIRYDEPMAAFERRRRDRQYNLQLSMLNPHLDYYGLTPRLAYTLTRNASNIGFYAFTRHRFEVGFTSSFCNGHCQVAPGRSSAGSRGP